MRLALDVCGVVLLVAAVGLAFGPAAAVAATGVGLLVIGFAQVDG